ncbi:MAG TPA: hypothetical protein VG797_01295 [Phycisphaerales bacterium]|nr:hypothetical protein [Phycisphaerales bacterium]
MRAPNSSPPIRSGPVAPVLFLLLAITAAAGAGFFTLATSHGAASPGAPLDSGHRRIIDAELRSWVVAGYARHLYLDLKCPPPYRFLNGRIEFTAANFRHDYEASSPTRRAPTSPERERTDPPPSPTQSQSLPPSLPHVARMTRGSKLRPILVEPNDRLEYRYRLSAEQAAELQRDRLFSAPYELLGPNSNAGLRSAMESVGLRLPQRILDSKGPLGEFPGIDQPVGPEVPPDQWRTYGIPAGPTKP